MSPSTGNSDADAEAATLSVDAILDFMAHHHRRAMLRALREAPDNTVSEDKLISRLQDQEQARTGKQPSWDHISAALHHIHEPKLSEAGIISYDESSEEYQYHPNDRVEKWLDHIESVHETEP